MYMYVYVYAYVYVYVYVYVWGFLHGSVIKNLPAMKESQQKQGQSLVRVDSLEEGMATHSSILTWKIPWTEKPCGLQSMGLQRVKHDCSNLAHTHTS